MLLQLFMTQVVTFLLSFVIPGMDPKTHPVLFAAVLGVSFSSRIFLAGWRALERHWLSGEPRYVARLVATLVGAYSGQSVHSFRLKPSSVSDRNRPAVPGQAVQSPGL